MVVDMCIDQAGYQVEPVPIDDFGAFRDIHFALCANLVDPVARHDDRLSGNGASVFNVNNRHIRDHIDTC